MSGVIPLLLLHASPEYEGVNWPYFSYEGYGKLKLWERLVEYLVIKLCCFIFASYVLYIAICEL
jgi:hypothetical protein